MSRFKEPQLREPPHNDTAELAVLASIMLDNRVLNQVSSYVRVESMYRQSHRILYRAMLELGRRGSGIDVITLSDHLHSIGQLESLGGPNWLAKVSNMSASSANVRYYLDIIDRAARARETIKVLERAAAEAYSWDNIDATLQDTIGRLGKAASSARSDDFTTLTDALNGVFDEFEHRLDNEESPGFLTGCAPLDELFGGFHPGRPVVIAGLSKMGKTKFTLQLILALMANNPGLHCDWWTCEMPARDMARRALSYQSRVIEDAIKNPQKFNVRNNMTYRRKLIEARANLASFGERFKFRNKSKPKLDDIMLEAISRNAEAKAQGGEYIVVVDYIQRVDAGGDGIFENVSTASEELTGMTVEHDLMGFFVSHFNRSAAQRAMPKASDAKGSGSLEQDAGQMCIVHRPFWDMVTSADTDHLKAFTVAQLTLNRYGDTGTEYLEADLGRNRFNAWNQPVPNWQQQNSRGSKR